MEPNTTLCSFLNYPVVHWLPHVQGSDPGTRGLQRNALHIQSLYDTKSPRFSTWLSIIWDVHYTYEGRDGVTNAHMAALNGHSEVLDLILDSDEMMLNCSDKEGRTPLIWGSLEGRDNTVQLLLGRGADVNAQGGEYGNALQTASARGHSKIVQMLLDKGADVNAQGGKYGNALQAASRSGHGEIVRLLIDKGADLEVVDFDGCTPVKLAAYRGHLGVVKLLVETGTEITVASDDGWTPLNSAADNGHLGVVKLLIEKGADNTAAGDDG